MVRGRVELQHRPVRVGGGARGRGPVRAAKTRGFGPAAPRQVLLPVEGAQPLAC